MYIRIAYIFVSFISATLICFRFAVQQNGRLGIENMLNSKQQNNRCHKIQ